MAVCKFFFRLSFVYLAPFLSAHVCNEDCVGVICKDALVKLNCASHCQGISEKRPSHISKKVWNRIQTFLLPEDHPAKPILDQLFKQARATLSVKSMKKAGFQNPIPRKWTHLIVTKHPNVPGIVFKLYLDAQRYFKGKKEYEHWLERIQGVNLIKGEVAKRGWENQFKTPKKWIYILPKDPAPPKEFYRKDCILVEEDMDLYDDKANEALWKSENVTKEFLINFYTLLEELGLHDCAKPDNAPFSKDGKIAFIDTQTFFRWPVLYKKMTSYLSKEMQKFWKGLIKGSKKKGGSHLQPAKQGSLLRFPTTE